jgi:hypothetical protein
MITLATQEAEIRRVQFEASLGRVLKTPSQQKRLGMVGCTCHPNYFRKHK